MVTKKKVGTVKKVTKKSPAKLSLTNMFKAKSTRAPKKAAPVKTATVKKAAAPKKAIIKKKAPVKNALLSHEKIQTAEGLKRSMLKLFGMKKK